MKLWKRKKMQILNPCRECIVKAMCQIRCPARQDFWDTREKLVNAVCKLMVTSAILTIIITTIIGIEIFKF